MEESLQGKRVRLSETKCLYAELLTRLGGPHYHHKRVTLQGGHRSSRANFLSPVNGSTRFVRKCRKWSLAQGSSGRRVTLQPGTAFLHINGA